MKPLCNPFIVCAHAIKCPAEGSVIECGVYDGATSLALRKALGKTRRQFAADTFEGMPYDGEGLEKAGGFVKGYLAPQNRDQTIAALTQEGIDPLVGMVEDTLPELENQRFAFAFLDLDLEAPTRFAASFLMPRIVPGGRIGFHDFLERDGYSLGGIAATVRELLFDNPKWFEVTRGRTRDNRFIFFERR